MGVDFQIVDGPVGILECIRVVLDVGLAGRSQSRARAVLGPDVASPIAAESGVEDNVVVHEMRVDITA